MLRRLWDAVTGKPQARITESSQLYDLIMSGALTTSGAGVTPNSAMQQSTVYSCVRVLSESTAQLPLFLYRRRGDSREPARDHPLWRLMHTAPSDLQTSYEFFETSMSYLNLRGNSVSYKSRSSAANRIVELIQFHPDQVNIKQQDDRSLVFLVNDGMDRKTYTQDEVLYFRGLSLNGWSGLSPIGLQRETIGLALATQDHGARMFKNGAKPSGLLKMLPFENAEKREAFRASFEAQTSGENTGRVAVIEGADGTVDYIPLSMTAEDAQYLETRKFQRSEIAGIFRVPPHMVGDLERATFSNIEEQSLQFVVYSLMPWLKRMEQTMNRSLLTPAEQRNYYFEFKVDGLLRGDTKSRSEFYWRMWQMGAMNSNEIRALENMNPRDDGDEFVIPANMETVNEEEPEETVLMQPAPPPDTVEEQTDAE